MKLTPTEQRIYDLLSDGRPHARKEVHACLWDDLGPLTNIQFHVCNLRAKLVDQGKEIICEIIGGKRIGYRLIPSPKSRL